MSDVWITICFLTHQDWSNTHVLNFSNAALQNAYEKWTKAIPQSNLTEVQGDFFQRNVCCQFGKSPTGEERNCPYQPRASWVHLIALVNCGKHINLRIITWVINDVWFWMIEAGLRRGEVAYSLGQSNPLGENVLKKPRSSFPASCFWPCASVQALLSPWSPHVGFEFWKPFSSILSTVINYSLLLRPQAKWPTWNCRMYDINQMQSWTGMDALQNAPCKLTPVHSRGGPTTVGWNLSLTFPAACILLNPHFLGYIIIVTPKRILREAVTPMMSETHLHLWLAMLCQHACACSLHASPNSPPFFFLTCPPYTLCYICAIYSILRIGSQLQCCCSN